MGHESCFPAPLPCVTHLTFNLQFAAPKIRLLHSTLIAFLYFRMPCEAASISHRASAGTAQELNAQRVTATQPKQSAGGSVYFLKLLSSRHPLAVLSLSLSLAISLSLARSPSLARPLSLSWSFDSQRCFTFRVWVGDESRFPALLRFVKQQGSLSLAATVKARS